MALNRLEGSRWCSDGSSQSLSSTMIFIYIRSRAVVARWPGNSNATVSCVVRHPHRPSTCHGQSLVSNYAFTKLRVHLAMAVCSGPIEMIRYVTTQYKTLGDAWHHFSPQLTHDPQASVLATALEHFYDSIAFLIHISLIRSFSLHLRYACNHCSHCCGRNCNILHLSFCRAGAVRDI